MKKITTTQSEMWDMWGKSEYDSELACGNITEVNPEMADYLIFPGEYSVNLPDEIVNADVSTITPPWDM